MDSKELKDVGRVRMNFWMSPQMYKTIEAISGYDARSMSDVIREAIRDYLEKRKVDLMGMKDGESGNLEK